MGGGGDYEMSGQRPGASGQAFGQVYAIGAKSPGQPGVRAHQQDKPSAAADSGQCAPSLDRVRCSKGAENHAGASGQARGDRSRIGRAQGVGEEEQRRQALSRPARAP